MSSEIDFETYSDMERRVCKSDSSESTESESKSKIIGIWSRDQLDYIMELITAFSNVELMSKVYILNWLFEI